MSIIGYAIMKSKQEVKSNLACYITTVETVLFNKIHAEIDCNLLNEGAEPDVTYHVQEFYMNPADLPLDRD